jgi:uncharacterized protein YqgV (UPF0045/DUF77 family)
MTPLYAHISPVPFVLNLLQVAEYIADCARILDKSGLKYQVCALFSQSIELFWLTLLRHHQMQYGLFSASYLLMKDR